MLCTKLCTHKNWSH